MLGLIRGWEPLVAGCCPNDDFCLGHVRLSKQRNCEGKREESWRVGCLSEAVEQSEK